MGCQYSLHTWRLKSYEQEQFSTPFYLYHCQPQDELRLLRFEKKSLEKQTDLITFSRFHFTGFYSSPLNAASVPVQQRWLVQMKSFGKYELWIHYFLAPKSCHRKEIGIRNSTKAPWIHDWHILQCPKNTLWSQRDTQGGQEKAAQLILWWGQSRLSPSPTHSREKFQRDLEGPELDGSLSFTISCFRFFPPQLVLPLSFIT